VAKLLPLTQRVLIDAEALQACVRTLATRIRAEYRTSVPEEEIPLSVVIAMNGAFRLGADLVGQLDPNTWPDGAGPRFRTQISTVRSSSYRGTSAGPMTLLSDSPEQLRQLFEDRHVLLVDDILDTGRTLAELRKLVLAYRPRSLRVCVLLEKEGRNETGVRADYVGFRVHRDLFVVGYGLDYDGLYRELNSIRAVGALPQDGRPLVEGVLGALPTGDSHDR